MFHLLLIMAKQIDVAYPSEMKYEIANGKQTMKRDTEHLSTSWKIENQIFWCIFFPLFLFVLTNVTILNVAHTPTHSLLSKRAGEERFSLSLSPSNSNAIKESAQPANSIRR